MLTPEPPARAASDPAAECGREPIHTPGSVQPFAVVLVVDEALVVRQCSRNAAGLLAAGVDEILGRPAADLLPADLSAAAAAAFRDDPPGTVRAVGRLPGTDWHGFAHTWDGVRVVELVAVPTGAEPAADLTPLAVRLAAGEPVAEFAAAVCDAVRSALGYDRVMVYRFDPDWHGQVIAEARAADQEPYLGLHYPATDIPPQARELYRLARVRVLADAAADPVPLVPRINPVTGRELDLSLAAGRAVSPVHREYLANMGVRATHVTSVLHAGRLWGLIACHHRTPRLARPEWAGLTDAAGRLLSAAVALADARDRAAGVTFAQTLLQTLPELLAGRQRLGDGLVDPRAGLLELMAADGLVVVHRAERFARGAVPPDPVVTRLVDWLGRQADRLVATDRLGEVAPEFAGVPEAAGLLALHIPNSLQGWVLWFRTELVQTVTWAGDPRKAVGVAADGSARLTPRASFAAWVEEVRGRSRAWTPAELATAEEVVRPNLLEVVATAYQQQVETLRRYQSILFEQVHDAVIVTDLDGVVTFWNDGAARTLGWTAAEMVGRSALDRIPPADRPAAAALLAQVQAGTPFAGRYRDTHKDGHTVWLDVRLRRIHDEDGRDIGLMGASRDVTAEKAAEDQLRLKQAIVRQARDNILVTEAEPLDAPGPRIVYVNESLLANTGYEEAELIGQTPRIFQGPATDRATLGRIRAALKAWQPVREELLNYRKDGTEYWIELDITPLADDTGWYTHWIGVQRDITDRKRAEAALREREAQFRTLAECLPDPVLVLDPDDPAVPLRIDYCSPTTARTYGYEPAELVGRSLLDLMTAADRERAAEHEARVLAGEVVTFEETHRHKDGRWFPVEVRAVLISWNGKRAILQVNQDITDRKAAEAELAQAVEKCQLLAENIADVVSLHDPDGRYLYVSPSSERLTGNRPADMIGRDCGQFIHPDDAPAVAAANAACHRGETAHVEWRVRRADGGYQWVESVSRPVTNPDGTLRAIIVSTRDIAPRKALEEQVRQAQKLEAVGRLAGGVAHDFNNLLTVVTGSCELLLADLPADHPHRATVANVLRAGERGAGLTRQLLAFGRQQVLRVELFDPAAVARAALAMLGRLIGEDVAVVDRLDPAAGRVRADPGQFEQVLTNLVVNARDAMPTGGTLTVTTARVEVGEPPPAADARPGRYVRLTVSDTGTGIPAEVRDRLFEPFFTTKPAGKGTGLGLATVYGIVRQSGGFVTVDSEVGRGSAFHVHFPWHEPAEPAPPGPAPPPPPPREAAGGRETVLVVEDEELVRRVTTRVLTRHGYTVLEAESAEAALAACDALPAPPDLVLTDVVMPGLSGRELAERLTARFPKLRVVLLSGYTADTVVRYGVADDRVTFLQKPYTPAGLAQFVRRVLDVGQPAPPA